MLLPSIMKIIILCTIGCKLFTLCYFEFFSDIETLEGKLIKLNSMIKALEKIVGDVNDIPAEYDKRVNQLLGKHNTLEVLTKIAKVMIYVFFKLLELVKIIYSGLSMSNSRNTNYLIYFIIVSEIENLAEYIGRTA